MKDDATPTPAEIWKILKEVSLSQKETDRQMKETDRQMKETDLKMKKTDQQIKDLKNEFSNRWGQLVESLIRGQLVKLLQKRDIKVTGISHTNYEGRYEYEENGETKFYEIDMIAKNSTELVVVEVKSTISKKKVDHFLKILKDFTKIFPEYSKWKIYAATAYLKSYQSADIYAMKKGLFVIKATGDGAYIANKPQFKPLDFSKQQNLK